MDVLTPLKAVFSSLARIMNFSLNLNGIRFTLGEMVIACIVLSLSVALLRYLFDKD